ncbi:hypothetical protein ABPG74_019004 [Tetrahymena malaccensis]
MNKSILNQQPSMKQEDIILKEVVERSSIFLVAGGNNLDQNHLYQIENNNFTDLGRCYHILSEQYFDILIQLFSDADTIFYFTLKFIQEIIQICLDNNLNPVSIHHKLVSFNNINQKFYYPQQLSIKILEKENVFIKVKSKIKKINQQQQLFLSKTINELIFAKANPKQIKNELQEQIDMLHLKLTEIIDLEKQKFENALNKLQKVVIKKYSDNNLYQIAIKGKSAQEFNSYDPNLFQILKIALIYKESFKNQNMAQCFFKTYQQLIYQALEKEKQLFQDSSFHFDLLKINKLQKNKEGSDIKNLGDFINQYYEERPFQQIQIEQLQFQNELPLKYNQKDPEINSKIQNMASNSQNVYLESLVQFSECQIKQYVEKLQSSQSSIQSFLVVNYNQKSKEWERERKLRITASNFGKICLSRNENKNTIAKQIIESKSLNYAAIQYGNNFESVARIKYIEKIQAQYGPNITVNEFGLIVDKKYNWIAGSPDGIVYENDKPIGCIEIKCPFSIKDYKINQYFHLTPFLEYNKQQDQIQLKRNHFYYYQCQGIMYLSQLNWCDFIVFTQVDIKIERICFDKMIYKKDLIVQEAIKTPTSSYINVVSQSNIMNQNNAESQLNINTKIYSPRGIIQPRKSQPNLLQKTFYTPANETTQTSFRPSTQGTQSSRLPKKLTMQLNKISKLFVTELNGYENYEPTNSNYFQTTQFDDDGDSYQPRFFNKTTSKFGSRSISTASLISRKKSDQAIESYKSASKKLRLFLKDQEANEAQNIKPIIRNGIESMKKISIVTPKASFSHGFSQIRDMKGYLNQEILTNQINPSQQIFRNQLNKNSFNTNAQNAATERFTAVPEQEQKIIQQINMSKFCSNITPGLEEELIIGKDKYNQLMQDIRQKESKLKQLVRSNYKLDTNEIHQSVYLNEKIKDLQKEIDQINDQIFEQERLKESLSHMKEIRYKDSLINSKPLLLHLEINQHMTRFLNKTSDKLQSDAKKITQLFIEMVEAAHEKKRQEQVQKEQWKSSQIKQQKEQEAERLAEFESTMRQIVKNNQKEQRKLRAEDLKQRKIQEELSKNALAFHLQEQIDLFSNDFIYFHQSYPLVSSYKDLLDFCVHVKENTQMLKNEEKEYKQINSKLQEEVNQLQSELQILKYSQETKTDQIIIQHNLERHPNEFNREDDFINIAEFEKEFIENKRKQHFDMNKVNKQIYIKNQYNKFCIQLIFKLLNQVDKMVKEENHADILLNGIHQRISDLIKKMPQGHKQRFTLKNFDYKELEESMYSLTTTIQKLQNLIQDITNGQIKSVNLNKQPSIQEEQLQENYFMNVSKSYSNQTPQKELKDSQGFDFQINGHSIIDTTSKPLIQVSQTPIS